MYHNIIASKILNSNLEKGFIGIAQSHSVVQLQQQLPKGKTHNINESTNLHVTIHTTLPLHNLLIVIPFVYLYT